jgi:uncharacterized membrane protein YozB (DUF420 family)
MVIENLLWGAATDRNDAGLRSESIGVRAAKRHEVTAPRQWMTVSCGLVVLWLVAHVTKQILVDRDQLGGTVEQYRSLYLLF